MRDGIDTPRSGYAEVLDRVADRAASAVVAKGRVRSVALRAALSARLRAEPGQADAFLADPVFEAALVWKRADRTLDDLAGSLLEEDLVAALDGAPNRRWPRHGAEHAPYLHQMRAWTAAAEGRSFLVTSGTGSGKTECFMVPMLNDLLRRSPAGRRRGVQAIVLYPLNALIDSQRERLGEWIAPLSGRITYALYNRHLKETLPPHEWPGGGMVPDRKRLREDPPSILVTNTTMLEYMLMRAQDGPILERSQGTLRWIVLDEAHSYVGAQAAEMALLLRRVREAFGVAPEDVRLAATSATIGEGQETAAALRRFVADLGGVPEDRVEIIAGEEREPDLPPEGAQAALDREALAVPDESLWQVLAPDPRIRAARARMRDGGLTLGAATGILGLGDPGDRGVRHQAFSVLEAAARARAPGSDLRLAPWRLHVFHRAQAGLWACIDPACPDRHPALSTKGSDWPYGQVHLDERERCTCSAPVFEVGACDECGTPWLLAERFAQGAHEYLTQARRGDDEDEYVLDVEPDPSPENGAAATPSREVLLGPARDSGDDIAVRLTDGALLNRPEPEDRFATLRIVEERADRACCARAHEPRTAVRPQTFGAPFLMGNAMPVLLEAVPRAEGAGAAPFGGRRLLSFTDSRQGTARFSAKLQQEAERNLTRAVITHAVQEAGGDDPARAAALQAEIEGLEQAVATVPSLRGLLEERQEVLAALINGAGRISWTDLRGTLAANPELSNFAAEVWRGRPLGGAHLADTPADLAELFLFRELFRRPRLQNNVETMGLARLVFPALEEHARLKVPAQLAEAGHDAGVWADVLHAAVDIVFRATLAIDLPQDPVDMRHWISLRSALSAVMEPGAPPDAESPVRSPARFPTAAATRGSLVRLLYRLTGGAPDNARDAERVDAVLAAIWTAFRSARLLKAAGPYAWRLDLRQAEVARLDRAWQCPQTWRLLPFAPAGVSLNAIEAEALATHVDMPRLPGAAPTGLTAEARAEVRRWLEEDGRVAALRTRGHWTDIHDRIAEFAPFLRAQEHSAQIDRASLQTYEEAFRKGRINILNCSTTMEMGVDIPDVGLVVNTNVPPAPANYRQRVGRAGRRGEPWALAFTFCKDLPLDRMVFREPARLLKGAVRAPAVRLDGPVLVQRHVNALLLGMYLRGEGGIRATTGIGTFFGATPDPAAPWLPDSPAEGFLVALQGEWADSPAVAEALQNLVRGTVLKGNAAVTLCAADTFERMRERWMAEYGQLLTAQAAHPERDPAHGFYMRRAKRMREEFMISELARRGFTPAYGFPVDVVAFDHVGRTGGEGGPSRPLDMAIRDYSPGAEVVIDGLVHRSDGILPTWGNRSEPGSVEDLRTLWRCPSCNAFGLSRLPVETCPDCGSGTRRGELLRPSGFLGTSKPHAAYETLAFVPPDRARVSAAGAPWVSLSDPATGALRTSREGKVLVTSSGPGGAGYAVCIACGRAEAETGGDGEALPAGMRDHLPLQKLRDNPRNDRLCPGNDPGSRRIRRNVRLGNEVSTDVFELRLDALQATEADQGRALAIGAAVREALAERLGIDAELMGVSVAPSVRADAGRRSSFLLYDKASGGSGFANTAEADLPALLTAAAGRLDCPSRCAHGCPDCILRRDLQFDLGPVDRPGGLEALRREVLPRLSLPEDLQVFGPATRALTEPVPDWIRRALAQSGLTRLTLFLHGDATAWDVMDWAGPDLLAAAQRGGAEVALALPAGEVPKLAFAQKLDLVRAIARSGGALRSCANLPMAGGFPIIAEIEEGGRHQQIATPSPSAATVGPTWGDVSVAPALLGAHAPAEMGPALSLAKLAAFGEGNSTRLDIWHQFDGPVAGFGMAFWKAVVPLRPQAFAGKYPVARVMYSDRYLRTPLSARLLAGILRAMPGRNGATAVEIVTEQGSGADREPPRALHHAWPEDVTRGAVLRALLPGASVSLRPKDACPHARSLRLDFADSTAVTIHLDQGLGAWRTPGRPVRFNGNAEPARQAAELMRIQTDVEIQGEGQHPSPLWVTW
ncbi:DEAD/DEAH box helicase [Amaricoccus solimangrovi]|nr:DEAD/DEAH box helicase [Amaricoccus solimangrovi]